MGELVEVSVAERVPEWLGEVVGVQLQEAVGGVAVGLRAGPLGGGDKYVYITSIYHKIICHKITYYIYMYHFILYIRL